MAGDFKNVSSSAAAQKAPVAERLKSEGTVSATSLKADPLSLTEVLAARDFELARMREALTASEGRAKFLGADLHARTAALAAVYASTTWRLTAPLRRAVGAMRWFVRGSWGWITLRRGSRPRRMARSLLLRTLRFVLVRPNLTRIARRPLERFPLLKSFQRRMSDVLLAASNNVGPFSDSVFSEREQFVHTRLRAALERSAD